MLGRLDQWPCGGAACSEGVRGSRTAPGGTKALSFPRSYDSSLSVLHGSGLEVSCTGARRGPPPWPQAQPSTLLLRFRRAEFGPVPWGSWSLRAPGPLWGFLV